MKTYDFDTPVDRRYTYSIKYDAAARRGRPADILPLWVADMDFKTPPCVTEALKRHADHGIFGYSEIDDDYFVSLKSWFSRRHGWAVERDSLISTPGIVFALYTAVRAFTAPGDRVLICSPVYYPFTGSVIDTERRLITSTLVETDGYYTVDFADFEQKIVENKVKLFILCNPHNPVGRVWKREELLRLGEICLRHNVTVISDEIHEDFVYASHKHIPFASLSPELEDITMTCTAPSKTFNLAGLLISNVFIKNPELRRKFMAAYDVSGMSQNCVMGYVACKAAYDGGEDWLEQLKAYLQKNFEYIAEFIAKNMPRARFTIPEGTYLAWLDLRGYGISDEELNRIITYEAKVWLDGGAVFGPTGAGFQRINVACPRSTLETAMKKIAEKLGK